VDLGQDAKDFAEDEFVSAGFAASASVSNRCSQPIASKAGNVGKDSGGRIDARGLVVADDSEQFVGGRIGGVSESDEGSSTVSLATIVICCPTGAKVKVLVEIRVNF